MNRTFVKSALAGALLACVPMVAMAQAYPSKTVTVVMPSGPGSSQESFIRVIFDAVSKNTGKTLVLDAKPGGLGAVSLSALARAEPDGHTVGVTFTGALLVNPHVTQGLPWDINSFQGVGRFFSSPVIYVSNSNFPAKNMADLIRMAKEKPESVSVGISGAGNKIGLAMIEAATGAKFMWVPLKDSPFTSVLGGHVNVGVESPGTVREQVKDGKLRALGIGSPQRYAFMPEVPAIAETVPGVESGFWFGMLVPKGVAADRIDWLNKEVAKVQGSTPVKERAATLGFDLIVETPAQFDAYLRKTSTDYARIIKQFNITN